MKIQIPEIPPEDEKNPTVNMLIETLWMCSRVIQEQGEQINLLKDEIAKLKGQKPRPKLPPSKTADDAKNKSSSKNNLNYSRMRKHKKKEQRIIQPNHIPEGSIFKGYEDFYIQDLRIESVEIQFRLSVYLAPDGSRVRGELPSEYRHGHFSAELIAYCLSQYHQCQVTEPLLHQHLYEIGIDISAAQLSNLLIKNKESFHNEKHEILKAGLANSKYLNADDTGSRHLGKNGYCTAIGSHLFTYFESSYSKSRINFLQVLQGNLSLYCLSDEALNYALEQGIGLKALEKLEKSKRRQFLDFNAVEAFLNHKKIRTKNDIKITIEALLFGGLLKLGINPNILTISDGARQFEVFNHGLCWVHEERHYRKLIPVSELERIEIETIRSEIWDYYDALKKYKEKPDLLQQSELKKRFDLIFNKEYKSSTLCELMARTRSRKEGLLLVLKFPFLPLHNNDCERDIREYTKRRKISGSTRSDEGRRARDTFASLKKTCMKLGIAFYDYLKDRLIDGDQIPRLAELIAKKSYAFSS
jgi:hypothetical protein